MPARCCCATACAARSRRGAVFSLAGGALLAAAQLAGVHTVWAILLPQYLFAIGHGMHQPCGQAGAVGPFPREGRHRGLAVGLHHDGWRPSCVGSVARPTLDGTVLPLTLGVGALSVAVAAVAWTLVQRHGEPQGGRVACRDAASVSRAPAGGALACLCLAGPTASGKSRGGDGAGRAAAAAAPVEIVSVDSALVYRGMDIGTAKPSRGRARGACRIT